MLEFSRDVQSITSITEVDVAPLPCLVVFVAGAFFAMTAILQPGFFGTIGLFVLFGTIFVISTGCAFVQKCRHNHSRYSHLR